MSRYRNGPAFDDLWKRRTTIEVAEQQIDLLALEDLVDAKKTQRDKDWPMITRLMERSYFAPHEPVSRSTVEFWLQQLRTPELLLELMDTHSEIAQRLAPVRPAIAAALTRDPEKVRQALAEEEREERRQDREFWAPLKLELEQLRHKRTSD
jgi:hypothetical protein